MPNGSRWQLSAPRIAKSRARLEIYRRIRKIRSPLFPCLREGQASYLCLRSRSHSIPAPVVDLRSSGCGCTFRPKGSVHHPMPELLEPCRHRLTAVLLPMGVGLRKRLRLVRRTRRTGAILDQLVRDSRAAETQCRRLRRARDRGRRCRRGSRRLPRARLGCEGRVRNAAGASRRQDWRRE